MSSGAVDWEALGDPLPISQIPKEKELRRTLFSRIDVNNNGYLTITEVLAGLPKLLEPDSRKTGEKSHYVVPLEDLRPAAQASYKMAQHVSPPGKGRKARHAEACIDRREFHALLVAFTIHVELAVLFERMDMDQDKRLHYLEVEKFVPKLEPWNITKTMIRNKFPDDWTPSMDFKDFAEWCILRKFHGGLNLELDENDPDATLKDAAGAGSLGGILKAFKDWDTDGNQKISKDELSKVLLALDDTFTQEMADCLMENADVNKDGELDYVEFSDWLTKAQEPVIQ